VSELNSYLDSSAELDLAALLDELGIEGHQMAVVVVEAEVEEGELLLLVVVHSLEMVGELVNVLPGRKTIRA